MDSRTHREYGRLRGNISRGEPLPWGPENNDTQQNQKSEMQYSDSSKQDDDMMTLFDWVDEDASAAENGEPEGNNTSTEDDVSEASDTATVFDGVNKNDMAAENYDSEGRTADDSRRQEDLNKVIVYEIERINRRLALLYEVREITKKKDLFDNVFSESIKKYNDAKVNLNNLMYSYESLTEKYSLLKAIRKEEISKINIEVVRPLKEDFREELEIVLANCPDDDPIMRDPIITISETKNTFSPYNYSPKGKKERTDGWDDYYYSVKTRIEIITKKIIKKIIKKDNDEKKVRFNLEPNKTGELNSNTEKKVITIYELKDGSYVKWLKNNPPRVDLLGRNKGSSQSQHSPYDGNNIEGPVKYVKKNVVQKTNELSEDKIIEEILSYYETYSPSQGISSAGSTNRPIKKKSSLGQPGKTPSIKYGGH